MCPLSISTIPTIWLEHWWLSWQLVIWPCTGNLAWPYHPTPSWSQCQHGDVLMKCCNLQYTFNQQTPQAFFIFNFLLPTYMCPHLPVNPQVCLPGEEWYVKEEGIGTRGRKRELEIISRHPLPLQIWWGGGGRGDGGWKGGSSYMGGFLWRWTSWIIEYFDIMCWTQLCLVNIKWRAVRDMWFGRTKRLFHFLPRFLLATLIDSMRLNLRHVHRSSSDQVWVRERTCVATCTVAQQYLQGREEKHGGDRHVHAYNQDSRVE